MTPGEGLGVFKKITAQLQRFFHMMYLSHLIKFRPWNSYFLYRNDIAVDPEVPGCGYIRINCGENSCRLAYSAPVSPLPSPYHLNLFTQSRSSAENSFHHENDLSASSYRT
jgi:hypothetical protein